MNTFTVKRGRKVTPVLGYIGQDDYGNAVFACPFGDAAVSVGGAYRLAGNTVPQANVAYVAAMGTETAERQQRQWFYASEANCNMCRHFDRLPYDKAQFAVSGVFYGQCKAGQRTEPFMVAPDDWMGMTCWEAR